MKDHIKSLNSSVEYSRFIANSGILLKVKEFKCEIKVGDDNPLNIPQKNKEEVLKTNMKKVFKRN